MSVANPRPPDAPVTHGARVTDERVGGGLEDSPALERLADQLSWYDHKSVVAQRWYKLLRMAQLVMSASIPVVAGFAVAVHRRRGPRRGHFVVEGAQQLFGFHEDWIGYRSTAEALKHHKYLYLSHAPPYAGKDRERVLAEQVESLVSRENAQWILTQPKDATPEVEA